MNGGLKSYFFHCGNTFYSFQFSKLTQCTIVGLIYAKKLEGGKIEWKLKKSTYSTTWKMKFSLLYLRRYVFFISLREVWMNILPSQQQLTSNQPPLTRNPKAKGKVNLSFSLNASNFVIHKHFVGWQRERWMFPVSSTHWAILN